MKIQQILLFLSTITLSPAAVLIDDFSSTSLSAPVIANSGTTTSYSGIDLAPSTLFGYREFTLAIDNRPVDSRFISAEISSEVATLSTSSPDTSGSFYLYHDSDFSGPYLDLSAYPLDSSEIMISFAAVPTADIGITIALQATDGQLLYRPTIPMGTSLFRLNLGDYSISESTIGDMSTIYETRWFFDIPAGSSYAIDSISIVPEPSTILYILPRASGYKSHRFNWLESKAAKELKLDSASSSWRGVFSNGWILKSCKVLWSVPGRLCCL